MNRFFIKNCFYMPFCNSHDTLWIRNDK